MMNLNSVLVQKAEEVRHMLKRSKKVKHSFRAMNGNYKRKFADGRNRMERLRKIENRKKFQPRRK